MTHIENVLQFYPYAFACQEDNVVFPWNDSRYSRAWIIWDTKSRRRMLGGALSGENFAWSNASQRVNPSGHKRKKMELWDRPCYVCGKTTRFTGVHQRICKDKACHDTFYKQRRQERYAQERLEHQLNRDFIELTTALSNAVDRVNEFQTREPTDVQ